MSYIIAEQFLSLPKKVQKIFIDWWEIKEGDIIYSTDEDMEFIVARVDESYFGGEDHWYYDYDSDRLMLFSKSPCEGEYIEIPLFRLDQLWDFIIDKSGTTIEVKVMPCNSYAIEEAHCGELLALDKDKLQAFWKTAVYVANENLRKEQS